MGSLCTYKDSLGSPGKGIHSYRILDLAVVDVLGSLGLAWLLSSALEIGYGASVILTFGLGVVSHRLFCVRTAVDRTIFG